MSETITPREYTDLKCDALEKLIVQALESARQAISKAEAASEKRFEGVNEFRAALGDSARLLMPRIESEKQWQAVNEKIDALAERLAARELMPRAESEKMHLDTKEKIELINSRLNSLDARRTGRGELWGYIVGGVGILIAVVTVANKLFGE